MLTDGAGIPLAMVVDGANRYEWKLLTPILDDIVVAHPETSQEQSQHLCLDAGYDYPVTRLLVRGQGYQEHIRSCGEERAAKQSMPGYRARRWVVEHTHS
jgi:putative transposase